MPGHTKIYIIGFMGSGKTTAGEKLAGTLGWSFIDLDRKIEERASRTISDIFSDSGEDYFREVEREILTSLKSYKNTVISTGGGTPCHDRNMDFMIETGLTIYLKLTPAQLASRLSGSSDERPLIKHLDGADLLSFIEAKLSQREKWYNRAAIIADGFNLDILSLSSTVRSHFGI